MKSFRLVNDQAESSWPARSDETERGHRDDHEQALKTLQLDHQDGGHCEEHLQDDGRDLTRKCDLVTETSGFIALRKKGLVFAAANIYS